MEGRIWDAFQVAETMTGPAQQFHRLHSRGDLTVGVLRILAGGMDLQGTHAQDEVYAVIGGRGILRLGDVDQAIAPGSIVFVPAGVSHRFHGNKEPLVLAYVLVPQA
jgi:mannose-6-phosphate isomerase-like protein (cupin superfamily)